MFLDFFVHFFFFGSLLAIFIIRGWVSGVHLRRTCGHSDGVEAGMGDETKKTTTTQKKRNKSKEKPKSMKINNSSDTFLGRASCRKQG